MPLEPIWEKKLDDIAGAFSAIIDKLKSATFRELYDSGWFHLYGTVWGFTDTTSKTAVWLPQDTLGRAPVAEQYSSDIRAYLGYVRYYNNNNPVIGRLNDIAGTPAGTTYNLKHVIINQILGAGGTLAATEIVALVGGKKLFPEEIMLQLEPATANISAVGGNAAVCTIDNSGGVVLATGVLTHTKQETKMVLQGSPTAGENLRLTVAAGIAGNVGASRIRGYILYREV